MIYFIHSNALNAVKIGRSNDVGARVRTLQTANPESLLLLATINGEDWEEKQLHKKFAHLLIKGRREWFQCTAELMIHIDDLSGGKLWEETFLLRDGVEDYFGGIDVPPGTF